jgi:hypothetical protein
VTDLLADLKRLAHEYQGHRPYYQRAIDEIERLRVENERLRLNQAGTPVRFPLYQSNI